MTGLRITARDRIFTAIALPVALLAAYAHFVHAPLARDLAASGDRLAELGDSGDLLARRPNLERRREEVRGRRAEAERAEAERLAGQGDAAAPGDVSARLRRFTALLGEVEGLRVTATERLDGGDGSADALVRETLGIDDSALWRFTVVSDYAGVVRALGLVSERAVPVIVEGVALDGASGRPAARIWKLDVRL